MKCIIRGTNVEVTSAIKKYAVQKISKLDKYFDDLSTLEAKIVLSVKNDMQKVEITLITPKNNLRVEENAKDIYGAIDIASDKLQRQFLKYKNKITDKTRKRIVKSVDSSDVQDYEEQPIVKRKEVSLKPMSEEEAILQMNLLDHTFFIFKNVNTQNINVLYLRRDGDYGVIEVE